ncbi:MAG TPA: NAD+ synthase, partial [Flavobacteriales bacterium]|nr:NAD+ synthase [Flavobacteriales bacterium]
MKIALAQINVIIGDFEGNTKKILHFIKEAEQKGADIVVFPELATTGYPPRDFLEFKDFIDKAEQSIETIKKATQNIAVVIGTPTVNPVVEGKDLYNSVVFLYQGKEVYRQHKTLLPTYDIFDEARYFEEANSWQTVSFKGHKIALTVCEDLWNLGNENPLYTINPMEQLMPQQPDLIINVSASPFDYTHAKERIAVLKENVKQYQIPLFYVNHVGAQTDIIFDGGSLAIGANQKVYTELPYFKEALQIVDLDEVNNNQINTEQPKEKMPLIHDALVLGIKDYFGKIGFKNAVIGLSGGLDSAVTTVLATEALGKENVRVLLMPSQFSSEHSVQDAKDLAENLGIRYDIVPIKSIFDSYLQQLDPLFEGRPFDVTEENIQARIRGNLLMAISNKFGNILLNTSNKSEMSVGYGTLYGDLAGGLSVIADVYKTEVYDLAHYINRNKEIIPVNTIQKPPSAELRPNQKDSDSLPDYDILDPILKLYIEG